ncbi:hypothetical protein ACIRBX_18665 [Kitasatospora sp. NPDC096147]|uniref:hypothetical protein n=1 Tax=Kitasatospora sp. NPDC096147 TaxID=3364093 RepID=UPI00382C6C20
MPHLAQHLLRTVDPLPAPRVDPYVARFARALTERELTGLLDDLDAGSPYERRLGALAALATRRGDRLAGRLADPDAAVRGYAFRAVRQGLVPDAVVEAAYPDGSDAERRQLALAVTAGRRTAAADRMVERVRERWGDHEAARLLTACSPEVVARLLPELAHTGRLAPVGRRHPALLMDYAEAELPLLTQDLRDGWWYRESDSMAAALSADPARVLGLLERHGPRALPSPLIRRLGRLVAVDPERVTRWLLDPARADRPLGHRVPHAPVRRLARAEPPSLTELGRRWYGQPQLFGALLRGLPPGRRGAFFDAATKGLDTSRFHAPDLLPHGHRRDLARAESARREAAGEPWHQVLELRAHLPAAEVAEELLAATRRPDAADRARAWPLLVANAGRDADPAVLTRLLTLLERLRNEQDPVRSAALTALAALHPRHFAPEHAAVLGRLVIDALTARDCSYSTRTALRRLAVGVLGEHATEAGSPLLEWSLTTLQELAGTFGSADLGPLERTLRRGQEHQVFAALRPWLLAEAPGPRHRLLFALAGALGRRAYRVPELQALLADALRRSDDDAFRTAVRYWLADPATRDDRVAQVLRLDPSAAVLPPVLAVLTLRRTDLLDPVLAGTPPYGRFLPRGTRAPLPPLHGARRWAPRQQLAAARLAAAAVADTTQPVHQRAAALGAAQGLPEHGARLALEYLDSAEVVLAEAALGALPWTGDPAAALAPLLARVSGDRARVAMYSASRAARYVRPAELERQLAPLAVEGRVTVRKEAVRLLARHLPPARAAVLLRGVVLTPGQHPDVVAAAIGVATELTERPEVWELFDHAAEGPDQVRRALVRLHPWQLAEPHRARYAAVVGRVCRSSDPEVAAAALDRLPPWARYSPEAADVLPALVTDLDARAVWRPAVQALVALAGGELPHPLGGAAPGSLLHRTVLGLLAADPAGEFEAQRERDRPARQRLGVLVHSLPAPEQGWQRELTTELAGLLGAEQAPTGTDPRAGEAPTEAASAAPRLGSTNPEAAGEADRFSRAHTEVRSATPQFGDADPEAASAATLFDADDPGAASTTFRFDPSRPEVPSAARQFGEAHPRAGGAEPALRAGLLLGLVDPASEPSLLAAQLADVAESCEDRPALALRCADRLARPDGAERLPEDPAPLRRVAEELAGHGGYATGLFAVALAQRFGHRYGWPADWRELLLGLRRHPVPDVRDRASTVFTAEE